MSSRQLAQNDEKLVSRSLSWWTACPVVGRQTSEVSVHWREPWCDDWGMSVLWRCCGSCRSPKPFCTRSCIKWATDAAHAVMAGHEIVLEPGERSWLHCFALAAEPECCWLEHGTALSCSSPVWSVWDSKPVSPRDSLLFEQHILLTYSSHSVLLYISCLLFCISSVLFYFLPSGVINSSYKVSFKVV